MEFEELEYQCSECGADVSSHAKNCPNCGASLEEIFEEETPSEEEFVEIPLTSDPSKLSAILSILDEKKIAYSINENPMENIWGPTFSQVPRLLISSDLSDEVNEIIDSIDGEEIEVLDKELSDGENQGTDIQREEIKGVEGWLMVLSLLLILGPIAYLPYNISTYIEIKNELTWFPFKDELLIIDLVLVIISSCLSIYAGLKLWRIRPDAIKAANLYFNVFLIYSVISLLAITIIFSISNIPFNAEIIFLYGQMIKETISSIIFVVVWKLYLKNSKRVKNTFGKNSGFNIQ